MLKVWFKAMRLPFLTATLIPVLLGNVIAWNSTGSVDLFYSFLTLLGISFLHIGTNLANDYFDHKSKNDEVNPYPTPFSGGSRIIQDGLISPNKIIFAALSFFTLGSIVGLYIVWKLNSLVILTLGLVGVFCGFFYTAQLIKLGYRGWGELIVSLCFGPLVVFGSFYVQTGYFSYIPVWASVPVALLIFLVLFINEFPDHKADKLVGKKTLVVILGKCNAMRVLHFLLGLIYFYTFLGIILGVFPLYTAIIFFTLPLAKRAYVVSKEHYFRINELLPANVAIIGLHFIFGLLLCVSFALDRIF